MKVLIVKLTSMGDLVHALPALSDAVKHIPGIRFDWVADESFAEVPRLHPAVDQIITTAHRRWRKEKWQTLKSGALIQFIRRIREQKYDVVIDAQNNLKSALVMSVTRGLRCGMDKNSTREKFTHLVCDKTFAIPVKQHAVDRQRQLFAHALNYLVPDSPPDFGIITEKLPQLPFPLPKPYVVFIHGTTWASKHWPQAYWEQLVKLATQAGYHVVLPWWSATEKARAQAMANSAPQTLLLPELSLLEKANVIAQSQGAVCVDTGLGHLTAALNIPAVHLYGPTDPALIGAMGQHQLHLCAQYECAPCYLHECKWGNESSCFVQNMRPEKVWEQFMLNQNLSR